MYIYFAGLGKKNLFSIWFMYSLIKFNKKSKLFKQKKKLIEKFSEPCFRCVKLRILAVSSNQTASRCTQKREHCRSTTHHPPFLYIFSVCIKRNYHWIKVLLPLFICNSSGSTKLKVECLKSWNITKWIFFFFYYFLDLIYCCELVP